MWQQSASGSDFDEERLSFPLRQLVRQGVPLAVAVVAVLVFRFSGSGARRPISPAFG
jgi:hypothetical protein